ncbi:eye-specific diacylglycerol kinase-like isoform X2 [Cylas formicarius]|uniref:eye-specific diacylglycerol kinase-like isoform X2 n=1 Tax=Cylas formicarius TaxID=197179 RepID=UPI002958CB1A|nr:eye-specific diacylglycerol kinase-like isoform X2 [Cylas formicarius]
MQRLRTTFKRSRTPTGAEMKTQSSLEVPKQVRSASFDEIQLEAKRQQQAAGQSSDPNALLRVPQFPEQRSRSVDSGGSEESGNYLEVPLRRFQRRRSSGGKSPVCVHCTCVEEYNRLHPPEEMTPMQQQPSISVSDSSSECEDDPPPECSITVTLSPTIPSPPIQSPPPIRLSPMIEFFPPEPESDVPLTPTQTRRKSIHRQEAFFAEPTGTSLENVSDAPSEPLSDATSEGGLSDAEIVSTIIPGLVVRDIYLQVPDLRRDRAASVDSCFSKVSEKKTEELQHSGVSLEVPVGPNVALRSRSVDIVLPTDEQARYKALAMAAPSNASAQYRKSVGGGSERVLRSTPDWNEGAINGDHLWVPTSVSGDFCYVGDSDCTKHGSRMKCSACNVLAHQNCINILVDRVRFTCKPTFRDVGVRQYREQTSIQHHWVHRRSEKGKCKHCGKSFQSKLSFSSKEIVAISCSWCKAAFHNKESCFNVQRIGEECKLGVHSSIIVPPSWIVKLPKKGSFKSSLRKTPRKRASSKKRTKDKDKEHRAFVVKPIPCANLTPVIVFINPKSGGNQGLKLLQKFQWLLNPRQVFDLTQGGPKMGLELFKKVPNLRVLACGGDGTVGWVLSVIDQIGMNPAPAVGVLPLGTGNDLARALGWGGGYTDEPVSKILSNISNSDTVLLDRWSLEVEKNTNADSTEEGKENLPLNVVNNYYSLGVDAHIALEFHEAREAHPEKFNSRLRNKMFYGQMGGKDLVKRKWKGLADLVALECDGQDITPKLRELRVHAIVFLNIPSYGGGTRPWNRSMGASEPSTEDGLIEVLGLTTYQLPLLQAGGHGTCITQCRSAKIITTKTIPMQVDGEACKLKPSIITLTHLNKANMLAKRKFGKFIPPQAALDNLKITVNKINMSDYEQHHYDKDLLTQAAIAIGTIEVNPIADLEQVRAIINRLIQDNQEYNILPEWCFVDSCTAERFFRVDRAQENLHYITDIACEHLYILECGVGSVPQTPEDETAVPSPSSGQQAPYVIPEMRISDEGSLDSPSDHPPMSPKVLQSPEDYPTAEETIPVENRNGDQNADLAGVKIRSNPEERPNETLLKASKTGDLGTVRNLHCRGYSLKTNDSTGQTMLHYAARFGHQDLVRYLINYAPSIIDQKDVNLGQTALHKAAAYKQRNICCMLVASGASLDIKDHRGNTAKLLALQADDQDLAAYLESQEHFKMVSADLGTIV